MSNPVILKNSKKSIGGKPVIYLRWDKIYIGIKEICEFLNVSPKYCFINLNEEEIVSIWTVIYLFVVVEVKLINRYKIVENYVE